MNHDDVCDMLGNGQLFSKSRESLHPTREFPGIQFTSGNEFPSYENQANETQGDWHCGCYEAVCSSSTQRRRQQHSR